MANKPDPDGIIVPRPSFTQTNADRFLEIFDSLLETEGQDMFIDPIILDIKASTLKHRMSEALLWLTMFKHPKSKREPKDYAYLRGIIRFKFAVHNGAMGVQVHFTFNLRKSIKASDAQAYCPGANDIRRRTWKEKVLEFLEDGNEEVFIMDAKALGCILSEEDQNWLKKTFESADIAHEVGDRLIRAAK